ncbi:MAG: glycosyltransferase [Oligoflexales bacterium]|nr:glycosyltransferase [Oligoflexales bacterium]
MKILMLTSLPWDSTVQVGSHHIAREFIRRGHSLLWLSYPVSIFHLLKKKDGETARKIANSRLGLIKSDEGLRFAVPFSLVIPRSSGFFSLRYFFESWHRYSIPNLMSLINRAGFLNVDLVYLDNFYYSSLLQKINYSKSILRIPDLLQGFSKFSQECVRQEENLIKKVDHVFCTSEDLLARAQTIRADSLLLENGVNYEHFSRPQTVVPDDLLNLPRPIALYVGSIEPWLDQELLRKAALAFPQISFVLVGPKRVDLSKLEGLKNLHFLGPKPYSELPKYTQAADFGLIPFDLDNFKAMIDAVNPLKLYEYFASGLPVVARRWKTIEKLGEHISLYDNFEQFASAVEQVLKVKSDRDRLKKLARERSWISIVDHLLMVLKAG